MSAAYQLLREAFQNRQSCYAIYDGYVRYFCPHVIGWKQGTEQVLCWQYAGDSSRPLPPQGQWKCFTISKIGGLVTTDQRWRDGEPGHMGKPTSCVDRVDLEIQI